MLTNSEIDDEALKEQIDTGDWMRRRGNTGLQIPLAELNAKLNRLVDFFEASWLMSRYGNPLQRLWRRKDPPGIQQLILFGDCVAKLASLDQDRLWAKVRDIKGKDDNNRRGAIFELLMIGYLNNKAQKVIPTARNYPGIDAIVEGSPNFGISFKCRGNSVHEQNFRRFAHTCTERFRSALIRAGANGIRLVAVSDRYPDESSCQRLLKHIDYAVSRASNIFHFHKELKIEGWRIWFAPLAVGSELAEGYCSHQVTIVAPFHRNEKQNLMTNLQRWIKDVCERTPKNYDSICIVVNFPETVDIANFLEAIAEAVRGSQDSTKAPRGILVAPYQLGHAAIGLDPPASSLIHTFRTVGLSNVTSPYPLSLVPLIGGISLNSPKTLLIGRTRDNHVEEVNMTECYYYQIGDIFRDVWLPSPISSPAIPSMSVPADGIHEHVVLSSETGRICLSGNFPRSGAVELLS